MVWVTILLSSLSLRKGERVGEIESKLLVPPKAVKRAIGV